MRQKLTRLRVLSIKQISETPCDQWVKVAGIVTVRQRPGTAGGVCFITIEDETGFTNLVVWESLFDQYRKEILRAKLLMVEGKLQREGNVVHVIVRRCSDYSKLLRTMNAVHPNQQLALTFSRADERSAPAQDVIPKGRNFK